MSDSDLKVTDKRMFTPEGELREEYRERPQAEDERAEEAPEVPPEGEHGRPSGADAERLPSPTVVDLIGLLAQSAVASLSEERQSPALARFHIDLLEVLREATRGNLDAAEQAALDEALYGLRMLYVEKTSAR